MISKIYGRRKEKISEQFSLVALFCEGCATQTAIRNWQYMQDDDKEYMLNYGG
jgi:hypothetical protein